MKLGILLLAGGKSSRMNHQDKAMLLYHDLPFIEVIANDLKDYPNKYLSLNQKQNYILPDFLNIIDEYEEIGPLGGIVSAFHQSKEDALFVITCDMPLFQNQLIEKLNNQLDDLDGIFIEDDKHQYLTLGIYTRKLLPQLEEAIQNKSYALYRAIKNRNIKFVHIQDLGIDQSILKNINTIEDYKQLLKQVEK